MRVVENGTDRKAEVHLYKEGKGSALEEYGEYIDPKDQAICCYIPVAQDDKLKIGGVFSGTTQAIVYDGVIDGVLRKRIDMGSFLLQTKSGTIETTLLIEPLSGLNLSQGEVLETVGTIELHLYITCQPDIVHYSLSGMTRRNAFNDFDDKINAAASFKQLKPTFKIAYEQNCATLEKYKSSREQKKMISPRPGKHPWAIFRFHYRSKDDILTQNLSPTFSIPGKISTEPHSLLLSTVPPVLSGAKLLENGNTSTQASSSAAPDKSSACSSLASLIFPPKTETQKQNTLPILENTEVRAGSTDDHHSPTPSDDGYNEVLSAVLLKPPSNSAPKSALESFTQSLSKSTPKEKGSCDTERNKTDRLSDAKSPAQADICTNTSSRAPTKPPGRLDRKPLPILTTLSATGTVHTALVTPPMTTKRPSASVDDRPESKRSRTCTMPDTSSRPIPDTPSRPMPAICSSTPSTDLKPASIEFQVAEQRKRLAELRQRRKNLAEKQSIVDKEMEPYRKRMAEELAQTSRELVEEEKACVEEEEQYFASLEILNVFKSEKSDE